MSFLDRPLRCPHSNLVLNYRENTKVCTGCGCVVGTIKQEIDTFDRMQNYAHQSKIGSVVNKKYKNVQKKAERYSQTPTARRLIRVRRLLDDLCESIDVSTLIKARATFLMRYILIRKSEIKQVKKDELLCAVCIYMALREQNVPLTYREIAHHCKKVEPKEICRIFKIYERVFCMVSDPLLKCDTVNYQMMVPRFCGLLGIGFLEQKRLRKRIKQVNKKCVSLKSLNPMTKFAVAVRLEFGDVVSIEDLHIICGVSKHTILKSVALLIEDGSNV